MAIASMTGFARTEGAIGALSWVWEIRSVNGRSLDIRMRVPAGYDRCGDAARKALAACVRRGACHVSLTVSRASQSPGVRFNLDVARRVLEAFATLERPPGVGPLTMDAVLAVRGVVESAEADEAPDEAVFAAIEESGREMIAAMAAMRSAEGTTLERLLRNQLDQMKTLAGDAEASPARRPEAIRARLAQQVELLGGAGAALDPQRLHQEAMILASRADIREELDRLAAHLEAAGALLEKGGPVGRRLDFLAQELSREANTLCAKANDPGLVAIGLELKAVVEQFREQVQNVE